MCEFVSWIEHKGIIYFLSDDQLLTPGGEQLRKYCGCDEDLCGHGAIRKYYNLGEDQGFNKECSDFSDPINFPREIRKMIKDGKFKELIIKEFPPLLSKPALAEYKKIRKPALAEFEKIRDTALAEYKKIRDTTWFALYNNSANRIKCWR